MLALNNPAVFGTGIFMAFLLVTLAGLVVSTAMARNGLFSKATASVGVLANLLGLGYFFTLAFAPSLTFIPLSASAPLLLAWYILIALRLIRLGSSRADACTPG